MGRYGNVMRYLEMKPLKLIESLQEVGHYVLLSTFFGDPVQTYSIISLASSTLFFTKSSKAVLN